MLRIVVLSFCLSSIVLSLPSMKSMRQPFDNEDRKGYYPPAESDYPAITPFPAAPTLPPSDEMDRLRFDLEKSHSKMHRDAFVIDAKPMESFNSPSDIKIFPSGKSSSVNGDEFASVGPIINPAAHYLAGADFDKIPSPKCRMLGCVGPLPNDGNVNIAGGDQQMQQGSAKISETCQQTFVPLNGCLNDKGYPVGMLCQICCDCSADFVSEMRNSRGYKENFQ